MPAAEIGGQIIPRRPVEQEDPDKQAKDDCKAKGGRWDEATKTCILPEPKIQRTIKDGKAGTIENGVFFEDKQSPTKEFDVLRDETGRLSGFKRGDTTLLGLPPSEVRTLAEKEAGLQELEVGGAAEAALAKRAERLQRQGLDLSSQVGNDPISQLQQQFSAQGVDYLGAVFSAVPDILPDLITGAAGAGGLLYGAGAVATVATGGAAAPVAGTTIATAATIGAIANVVRGFYSDFVSDVKRQKGELIETPIRTLTETKSIMNDITSAQNANPAESVLNLEAFNQQLQLIDDEYDRLKDLTDDELNKFLGDTGINQLQEYEVYYTVGGERERQIRDFQLALANPDPALVRVGGETLKQLKDRIDRFLAE